MLCCIVIKDINVHILKIFSETFDRLLFWQLKLKLSVDTYYTVAVRVHQFAKRCVFLNFKLNYRIVLPQHLQVYVLRFRLRFLREQRTIDDWLWDTRETRYPRSNIVNNRRRLGLGITKRYLLFVRHGTAVRRGPITKWQSREGRRNWWSWNRPVDTCARHTYDSWK